MSSFMYVSLDFDAQNNTLLGEASKSYYKLPVFIFWLSLYIGCITVCIDGCKCIEAVGNAKVSHTIASQQCQDSGGSVVSLETEKKLKLITALLADTVYNVWTSVG